jgi:L-ascorbate metabolism protein UlaG (beta-lactamase superfamily)
VDLVVQTHPHFDHFELKLETNLLKKETKNLCQIGIKDFTLLGEMKKFSSKHDQKANHIFQLKEKIEN